MSFQAKATTPSFRRMPESCSGCVGRLEMLNPVQHDVRYICEMPDYVRHDDAGVIPVPTRHSGYTHVIPANAGILFRLCRRFEMLNQVQHDVRYICEMPDHVRHDDMGHSCSHTSFLFPHVIPANAGISFRLCRRLEMLNPVQHDVRYICEMPDHVLHDVYCVIPVTHTSFRRMPESLTGLIIAPETVTLNLFQGLHDGQLDMVIVNDDKATLRLHNGKSQ